MRYLTAFGYVAQLPGQPHVLVGVTPRSYITVRVPVEKKGPISNWTISILCVNVCSLLMLACRPAETVTADPQLQSIGSPGIVQLAPKFWDVPWKASRAALSDGLCAPIWLTRVLHALLVGLCLKMASTRNTCQSNCPSVCPASLCHPFF